MAKSAVAERHVLTSINGKVRHLTTAQTLQVTVPSDGSRCSLVVIRDGNAERLPISERVAEELIARGFAYGD